MDRNYYRNKSVQILFASLVTIFLGAIGSGLWELIISRFFYWLASQLAKFIGSIYSGYIDFLHSGIGEGPGQEVALLTFTLLTGFISGAMIFVAGFIWGYMQSSRQRLQMKIPLFLEAFRGLRFGTFLALFLVFSSTILMMVTFKTTYASRAAVFLERSIEMIRPHIPAKNFVALRAEYRSINSAEQFFALKEKIEKMGADFHVKIPDFKPIR